MSTLCADLRAPHVPDSNAPRWRRLVDEQDLLRMLSSVQQGAPLLPASREPVSQAPQGVQDAQQWFNSLPDETAKSIVSLRRAQLYSCKVQARPQGHPYAQAAARPSPATLEAATADQSPQAKGVGNMARLSQTLARQPAPAAPTQPPTATLLSAAPALVATDPPTSAAQVPSPRPSTMSMLQPAEARPPPASMSPLRRLMQPQHLSPNSSPLRGAEVPLAAGGHSWAHPGSPLQDAPGMPMHRMFHPPSVPPHVHLDQLRSRTRTLFSGAYTNPLAAKLHPPNTRPTALGPGSIHSAPTLMSIQQVPSPGRPMPPPPPPSPLPPPTFGQPFGLLTQPGMAQQPQPFWGQQPTAGMPVQQQPGSMVGQFSLLPPLYQSGMNPNQCGLMPQHQQPGTVGPFGVMPQQQQHSPDVSGMFAVMPPQQEPSGMMGPFGSIPGQQPVGVEPQFGMNAQLGTNEWQQQQQPQYPGVHGQQPLDMTGGQFGLLGQPGMGDWQQQPDMIGQPDPMEPPAPPVHQLPWYKDMSPQRINEGFQNTFTIEKMNKLGNRMTITPEKLNKLAQRFTITPERMQRMGERMNAAGQRVSRNLSIEHMSQVGQRMSPTNLMPHNRAARLSANAAGAKGPNGPSPGPDLAAAHALQQWQDWQQHPFPSASGGSLTDPSGCATDQVRQLRNGSDSFTEGVSHANSAPTERLGSVQLGLDHQPQQQRRHSEFGLLSGDRNSGQQQQQGMHAPQHNQQYPQNQQHGPQYDRQWQQQQQHGMHAPQHDQQYPQNQQHGPQYDQQWQQQQQHGMHAPQYDQQRPLQQPDSGSFGSNTNQQHQGPSFGLFGNEGNQQQQPGHNQQSQHAPQALQPYPQHQQHGRFGPQNPQSHPFGQQSYPNQQQSSSSTQQQHHAQHVPQVEQPDGPLQQQPYPDMYMPQRYLQGSNNPQPEGGQGDLFDPQQGQQQQHSQQQQGGFGLGGELAQQEQPPAASKTTKLEPLGSIAAPQRQQPSARIGAGRNAASAKQAFGLDAEGAVVAQPPAGSGASALRGTEPPMRLPTTLGGDDDEEDEEPLTRASIKSGLPSSTPAIKAASSMFGSAVSGMSSTAAAPKQGEFGLGAETQSMGAPPPTPEMGGFGLSAEGPMESGSALAKPNKGWGFGTDAPTSSSHTVKPRSGFGLDAEESAATGTQGADKPTNLRARGDFVSQQVTNINKKSSPFLTSDDAEEVIEEEVS